MPPPLFTFVAQTGRPVSALAAKTHPSFDPTKRHPSAMIGVPVKSPSPPPDSAENANAGCSVETLRREMTFSRGWLRVFD